MKVKSTTYSNYITTKGLNYIIFNLLSYAFTVVFKINTTYTQLHNYKNIQKTTLNILCFITIYLITNYLIKIVKM